MSALPDHTYPRVNMTAGPQGSGRALLRVTPCPDLYFIRSFTAAELEPLRTLLNDYAAGTLQAGAVVDLWPKSEGGHEWLVNLDELVAAGAKSDPVLVEVTSAMAKNVGASEQLVRHPVTDRLSILQRAGAPTPLFRIVDGTPHVVLGGPSPQGP